MGNGRPSGGSLSPTRARRDDLVLECYAPKWGGRVLADAPVTSTTPPGVLATDSRIRHWLELPRPFPAVGRPWLEGLGREGIGAGGDEGADRMDEGPAEALFALRLDRGGGEVPGPPPARPGDEAGIG